MGLLERVCSLFERFCSVDVWILAVLCDLFFLPSICFAAWYGDPNYLQAFLRVS